MATIPALVAADLGVSVLRDVAATAAAPAVSIVHLDPPMPCHTTALATRDLPSRAPAASAFWDFVRATSKLHPAAQPLL